MYLCRLNINWMKKILSKILVPALLISCAATQSFGVDMGRASKFWNIQDSLHRLALADSAEAVKLDSTTLDSVKLDSIKLDSTKTDSVKTESKDTNEVINPLDTIVIPVGLDTLDPFKFKYYYEIKDSATRAHTRDSLLLQGDTIEVMKLDSLYVKDSTEVAEWKFAQWWKGLSRVEKKRWKYEQELPAKLHRTDSILHRKDSLKQRKDSIIAATPRILDTYVIPDSLQYKRLIMWDHERYFNDIRVYEQDTTYNYHFNDYPYLKKDANGTFLGVAGSAVQPYNFFKRREIDGAYFYTPYDSWTYSPETLPQYNTKTPYTELCYWGTLFANTEKEEGNIKIMTTQNILPEWNLNLEYSRFGANGMLRHEDTDNRTAVVSTNYMGKKYLMHAGYIYNKIKRSENGGIIDNMWIRDTTVDVREIETHLKSASNEYKKHQVYLDQTWRIPFNFINKIKAKKKNKRIEEALRDSVYATGDSVAIANYEKQRAFKDTLVNDNIVPEASDENITTAFIGHTSDLSIWSKFYKDDIQTSDEEGRNYYNNAFYLHPTQSADSLKTMKVENKIFLRLQPWKSDAILSKIDIGIGDKFMSYYNFSPESYLRKGKKEVQNSAYIYAGVLGQYKKYLKWNASGKYNFVGYEVNDFNIKANVDLSFYPFRRAKESPLNLGIHFDTSLKEPDFYQQKLYHNHYRWNNNFGKTSVTRVQAELNIPRWEFELGFGYALLNNNIYYDNSGIVRQNTEPMSVITGSLVKNFKLWKFHFDNQVLVQFSSNKDVLPLPTLALNLRWYFQFNVVKKVMEMQIGLHGLYDTKWYMPAWNPALGVFQSQNEERYGNCPYFDLFVNVQWKRACIFVKFENLGMGWPCNSADYFGAHGYIRTPRAVKIGIHWPFYVQSKSARSASNAASGGGNRRPGGLSQGF